MSTNYKEAIKSEIINEETFVRAVFSGAQKGLVIPWRRVIIRPVIIRGGRNLQFSYSRSNRDTIKNYSGDEALVRVDEVLQFGFRNFTVQTTESNLQWNVTKKGKLIIGRSNSDSSIPVNLSHDRSKKRILAIEDSVPFLQAVGILTQDGKIATKKQNKYRQIDGFLRLVLQTGFFDRWDGKPLHVVDFGCGNAYLTFAIYHYLNDRLGFPTQLVGVDVKEDILERHAEKADSLGWSGLTFEATRILNFKPTIEPDIVMALHACDTATDEALAQGVRWQSKLIISAPCCHHHLQVQLRQQPSPSLFRSAMRHNILTERLGDILTDTFRALILEIMGYDTSIVQFVSSEHSAKNLMIRSVHSTSSPNHIYIQEYNELKAFWQVTPYLEHLLGTELTRRLHGDS